MSASLNQGSSTTILNGDFFSFSLQDTLEMGVLKAGVKLNLEHEVYNGHFPGLPVVPGVCLVQMLKEILGNHLLRDIRMIEASNIKFIAVVNPHNNPLLNYNINFKFLDEDIFQVNCFASWDDTTFFKFSGKFKLTY